MSKAIADLTNDHQTILSVLDVFSKMLDTIKSTDQLQMTDIENVIEFLLLYVDDNHLGKEEKILFQALYANEIPVRGGPIIVMVAEHLQGRGYIHDLQAALDVAPDFGLFEEIGRKFVDLLKDHIYKENSVLFPMADGLLGETKQEELFIGFQEHERKVMGSERHRQLRGKVDALMAKYCR